MIHILDRENTLLNTFVSELRDVKVQSDSMRFRRNLERVGEIMAYEISKKLTYVNRMVETPLGEAEMSLPTDEMVIASILRAGIPLHQGFLNYFDRAESAFVSAYRKYGKDGDFKVKAEYASSGNLEGKTLILVDPMIATGASIELAYNALVENGGKPAQTHISTVIASDEGIEYVKKHLPKRGLTIWAAAVDHELTVRSYVVPGIGDVGDLAYGEKL